LDSGTQPASNKMDEEAIIIDRGFIFTLIKLKITIQPLYI